MAKKIGILGGGQLGKMLIENALRYDAEIYILDPHPDCSCAGIATEFMQGDFNDEKAVLDFAEKVDVLGIEIEHVNLDALRKLESQGKKIIPSSKILSIINDKGNQKEFLLNHQIKTAPFYLMDNKKSLDLDKINYPFVQKLRTGGYDGKGVQIIKNENDLEFLWNAPSVIEEKADIDKEIAIIAIKNKQDFNLYNPVEMVFDEQLNLVDYLICPAHLSEKELKAIKSLALKIVRSFDEDGIYAIELFLNKNGKIWVNEIAPRVHNSGHHTIESCYSSQFDNYFRLLADYPMGDTNSQILAGMINILGKDNFMGTPNYSFLDSLLKIPNLFIHLYGKKESKPGRKMGHITLIHHNMETLKEQIKAAKAIIDK